MPRIPKFNLGKAIPKSTTFPDPMWMRVERRGANGWEQLDPEEQITIRADWPVTHHHITSGYAYPGSNFIEETNWVPVQGPDLPYLIEQRRQAIRNAQEAYEDVVANERARQAYNRRVAAWNSYSDLPPRERAFIANQNRLRETLYDYMPSWEAKQYARNFYNYEAMPPVKMVPGDDRTLDLDELKGFESFDEFPDNGWVDMPWNRWK